MPSFLRRHPRPVEIGAWFDGERDDGVGAHVAGCARCRARASELARLRAVLRPAVAVPPRLHDASGDPVARERTP
ncbi:MAG: hypothetical protein M3Q48_05390 [Actinomycetota bacterium]|nr:hypothetical protein [Actinomycetota bacterium]